jgi:hypothetical protein
MKVLPNANSARNSGRSSRSRVGGTMQLLRDYPGSLPSEIFYPIGLISRKGGTGNSKSA